eukprot:3185900-Alexandrium_andersonii.AAC.2
MLSRAARHFKGEACASPHPTSICKNAWLAELGRPSADCESVGSQATRHLILNCCCMTMLHRQCGHTLLPHSHTLSPTANPQPPAPPTELTTNGQTTSRPNAGTAKGPPAQGPKTRDRKPSN